MISPVFQPFRIRPPRPIVAALGLLVVAGLPAACGDGLGPESDRAPQAVGDIPDLLLQEGRSAEVDVAAYFTDPEGGGAIVQCRFLEPGGRDGFGVRDCRHRLVGVARRRTGGRHSD